MTYVKVTQILLGQPSVKIYFKIVTKFLTSENILTYFDPTKPIYITCDSSGYGVGAV